MKRRLRSLVREATAVLMMVICDNDLKIKKCVLFIVVRYHGVGVRFKRKDRIEGRG